MRQDSTPIRPSIMWNLPRMALAFACAALVMACATGDSEEGVARTWNEALVQIPAVAIGDAEVGVYGFMSQPHVVKAMDTLSGKVRIPTVLYLHGCTGIDTESSKDLQMLADFGYAVIAPDSFARRNRPQTCNTKTHTSRILPHIYDYRQAEIAYAAERIRALGWVDHDNIFLMGFSEGGIATARYEGDEFNGHIISGWTCQSSGYAQTAFMHGVAAAPSKPILAIVGARDPWFQIWNKGHCGMSMAPGPHRRSIVIDTNFHHATIHLEAQRAIREFLRSYSLHRP